MSINATEGISEKDAFENSYNYFIQALEILAESAPVQCEMMGNYNVAWELKDEASAGAYLFNCPSSGRLSADQKSGILDIMAALEKVPSTELPSGPEPGDNLAAMNHPSWEPLRQQATALLALLAPATEECKRYLLNGPL